MSYMDQSEFINQLNDLGIKEVMKETTEDCYPGRLYAVNRVGLVGYWSEKAGYTIFKAPLKRFSTTKRTFQKIRLKDL